MNKTISNKIVKEIIEDISYFLDFTLTKEQVISLLENDKELKKETLSSDIVDTAFREEILDAICRDVKCSKMWPKGLDGKRYLTAFEKEFVPKAVEKGYDFKGYKFD